jgi:hypothetical protein
MTTKKYELLYLSRELLCELARRIYLKTYIACFFRCLDSGVDAECSEVWLLACASLKSHETTLPNC